jgi:uncharacterized protein (TIGR03663 family)
MTPPGDVMASLQRLRRRGASWFRDDEYATLKLVAAITLVGLVLRLVFLGQRVAHFDEGRVAYWAWHFGDTGSFAYRYIIHGPFIQHVDRWVFAALGANDFTMRLPVAVVGGLLPLSALLFRRHLRRAEVVALSLLFALNPLLVYYSRFMRSDMLVAAFMFTAFGLLVRLYDTRRPRYLYAAGFFLALGFASKENALVYVVTWLGATGLLLAKVFLLPGGFRSAARFLRSVPSAGEVRARLVAGAKTDWALLKRVVGGFRARHDAAWLVASKYTGHILLALLLFEFVSLFFYAPRGAGVAGIEHPPVPATAPGYVGFWEGITNPSLFGDLLYTTVDRVVEQWGEWLNPASEKELDAYESHLKVFLQAMGFGAGALSAFAAVGYVLDRWGYTPPRHLIPFCFYAGFVSIFGYPLGTDIGAPWIATHAVVPLAVPAAVGLTALFHRGTTAVSEADSEMTVAVALVLLVATGFAGNAAATMVYTNTTDGDNALVQFAQPSQELRGELDEMRRVAADHDTGPDVVVYYGESGEEFDDNNAYVGPDRGRWDESWWNTKPTCLMWYNSLPMAWYFAAGDVDVACENDQLNLGTRAQEAKPPIIITQNFDTTVPQARLETAGYEGESYMLRTSGERNRLTVWRYNESADNSTVR